MPDVENDAARRGKLLPVLFWGGVGLAPLAGLLLVVGNGGGFRLGTFLGLLSLVLLGLSVALRPSADTVRLQMEETLLEEVDRLRAEMRDGIAASSRATHQTVGERLGVLQQAIDSLRAEQHGYQPPRSVAPPAHGQVAPPPPAVAGRAVPPPAAAPRSAAPRSAAPRSAAPHSAAPQQRAPAQPRSAPPVGRRAAPPPPVSGPPPPPVSGPAASNGRNGGRGRRSAQPPADDHRPASTGRAAAAAPAGGVYRHTETVQVTTRSTYVDEPSHNGDRGRGYDGGYGSRDWSGSVPSSRSAEPYEESWTDQKLRERYSRRPRPYDSRPDDTGGDGSWSRDGSWQPVSAEPVSAEHPRGRRRHWDDDSSGELPAGDYATGHRWAAVRNDDRGRELRVGERHAARHSDDRGDELRLDDRWASVRREDDSNSYGRASYGQLDYGRSDNGGHAGSDYGRPDYSRRALPAAAEVGGEPSWNDWDEPVREPRSHRYRPDFELTDERWR